MSNIKFTPEQKELASKLMFSMEMHLNMDKEGILQHGCTYQGIKLTKVVRTPKSRYGQWGMGVLTFHIQDDKKEYTDVCEFLNAIISRTMRVSK